MEPISWNTESKSAKDYGGNKRHITEHESLCAYSYFVFHSIYFKQEKRPIFFLLNTFSVCSNYMLCLLFLEATSAGFYPCFSLFLEYLCSTVLAFRTSRNTKAESLPCLLNLEIWWLERLFSLCPYTTEKMLWMLSNRFLFNYIKWKFMDIVLQK